MKKKDSTIPEKLRSPIAEEVTYQDAVAEGRELYKVLRKTLKSYTKNQLVELVIKYGADIQEQINVNRILLEENKKLKESKNEIETIDNAEAAGEKI